MEVVAKSLGERTKMRQGVASQIGNEHKGTVKSNRPKGVNSSYAVLYDLLFFVSPLESACGGRRAAHRCPRDDGDGTVEDRPEPDHDGGQAGQAGALRDCDGRVSTSKKSLQ